MFTDSTRERWTLIETTDEIVISLRVTRPPPPFSFVSKEKKNQQIGTILPAAVPAPFVSLPPPAPCPCPPTLPLFLFSRGHEAPAAFLNTVRVLERKQLGCYFFLWC